MTMPLTQSHPFPPGIRPRLPRTVWIALLVEALTSLGSSQLLLGIFFFTTSTLGWQPRHNLLLAAALGAVYVFAALGAEPFSRRLGRRRALVAASLAAALLALAGFAARSNSALVAATLLAYTIVSTPIWPVLESMVAGGADPREMGRRIGIYNLVWSGVNIIGVALIGTLLTHWPAGVFILPALAHLTSVLLILLGGTLESPPLDTAQHADPEPELMRLRTLALWLSRISLPATYMVASGLMALMPTLPVIQSLPTTTQTLVGSVWLAARWLAFLALGATAWWHTRPLWLLWSTIVMLVAFLGITVRFSAVVNLDLAVPFEQYANLVAMIFSQILLGLAVALIYAGSLYFGMVLSDGSTEHGGYHEALIGAGSLIGPGSGALAQWLFPGKAWVSIAAVSGVIALTTIAGALAAIRARRTNQDGEM